MQDEEVRPCRNEICRYTDDEYRKLLDLCAAFTLAWHSEADDYADQGDAIAEYVEHQHPNWQG